MYYYFSAMVDTSKSWKIPFSQGLKLPCHGEYLSAMVDTAQPYYIPVLFIHGKYSSPKVKHKNIESINSFFISPWSPPFPSKASLSGTLSRGALFGFPFRLVMVSTTLLP